MGLSIFTLLKLAIVGLVFIIVVLKLKLSPNSPLFVFLSIVWMMISVFVVKSSLGDEVRGFYSSFLVHPFTNHIFPLRPGNEGYKSLYAIQDVQEIARDYVLSKEGDILAFIKLDNGIALNQTSEADRMQTIELWGNFLAQIQSISSIDSYLFEHNAYEDCIQAFIWVKPFNTPSPEIEQGLDVNLAEAAKINHDWYQDMFLGDNFIPDQEFYLVLRHRNTVKQGDFAYKTLAHFMPRSWILKLLKFDLSQEELEQEFKLLEQKVQACINTLKQLGIKSRRMNSNELEEFCDYWISSKAMLGNACTKDTLLDKSKYLKFKNRYYKTYRISLAPENGELDFWLSRYIPLLDSESYISIQWLPRNPNQDRRRAENKSETIKEFAKNSKASTVAIIQENRKIAEDLINSPHSFDLVIYITIIANDIKKIQEIDNQIRRPIKQAKLDSLDRQQVNNWIYSLPFAFNKLGDRDKLFANLEFARSCFPFVKSKLGTKAGPLMGLALEDARPIYLDEYDRSYCNNRNINFIGDSGSGKTVSAKLAVARRIQDSERSFYVVDNTEDGWKFFIDYFAGSIIEIDKYTSSESDALFSPLDLSAKSTREQFNHHIEKLITLLNIIKEDQSKISATERGFLNHSIGLLYKSNARPMLSDLYGIWDKYQDHELNQSMAMKWSQIIAPYCHAANGIYANLMDTRYAKLDLASRLVLFTFSQVDRDSNFLPVSLYLVSNFINKKVLFDKQAKTTFIIDEAWKIFTGKYSERGKDLLTHFARAGRGLDLGLWNISQKPSDLPREVHSSASCTLSFQLKEASDRNEMASYSNLGEAERSLLELPPMFEPGNCLLKSTKSSGLIQVALDPLEQVLCNSNRDYVTKRNRLYQSYLAKLGDREAAALSAAKDLM